VQFSCSNPALQHQYAHPLGIFHIGFVRTTIKLEPGGHRVSSFALSLLALPWCNFFTRLIKIDQNL
jgi:hypothetical protein